MNIRSLALVGLALAVLAPAAIVTPAVAKSDPHSCIFPSKAERDGLACNPFATEPRPESTTYGVKAYVPGERSLEDFIIMDTRGRSQR